MGIFVDYIPMEKYQELQERKRINLPADEADDFDYLKQPNVSHKTRLKVKAKKSSGDVYLKKKFQPGDFPFNPYTEPRECAEWARKFIGEDAFINVFQMGGQPPYRKLFKGIVRKNGNNTEIKYFCKEKHESSQEEEYDGKVIDMSKSEDDYQQYAGL